MSGPQKYGKILWAYEGTMWQQGRGWVDVYGETHANTRRAAMAGVKKSEGWARWPRGIKIFEIGRLKDSFMQESTTMKHKRFRSYREIERLVEQDGRGAGITLAPDSVDTQIDSLLVSFENESEESEESEIIVPEGSSIRSNLMRLLEAEDDEEEPAEDEAVPEEKPITTDAEPKTDDTAEPLTPKVNIDAFAERVAMLIETYTKRLDVETVIFNRAKNYLIKEYDEQVGDQFEEIMVHEHDIDLRPHSDEEQDPGPVAPPAAGAGPSI